MPSRQMMLGILFVATALVGCSSDDNQLIYNSDDPNVIGVSSSDEKMNVAMQEARATLENFFVAAEGDPGQKEAFAVKIAMREGGEVEHIWLAGVQRRGDKMAGVLSNQPRFVTTHKLGDTVLFTKDDVSDWMYVDNGKLVGGYTMRVIRDSMSPSERAQHDADMWFEY